MTDEIRVFGERTPGVSYVLRPGGYAVIFDGEGRLALVATEEGLHLPGGGQEPGETAETAAIREVAEETGLRVAIESTIGVADEFVFVRSDATHYRKRCTFFRATTSGAGEPIEPDHELQWVDAREAVRDLCHESQRWAVEQALRGSARESASAS